mmetsp:Transcript_9622/g.17386  ORF Transcript_9622/g.17386 Transcript_9622/m.17386 type:complete len:95 (+) Transcript_9622:2485-2769(+)
MGMERRWPKSWVAVEMDRTGRITRGRRYHDLNADSYMNKNDGKLFLLRYFKRNNSLHNTSIHGVFYFTLTFSERVCSSLPVDYECTMRDKLILV